MTPLASWLLVGALFAVVVLAVYGPTLLGRVRRLGHRPSLFPGGRVRRPEGRDRRWSE